ncbi:MAG: AarF/ABC1/UbiB kinase family protein [Clostridia bacterium]|nr:AarF/ABC1/UbiB kinase family protein [Clostridia bacterium]
MKKTNERKRIRQIISVFIKHGVKRGILNPEQLRLALEELGPTFIKIGQMLSTRPDILPDSYIVEFEKLQDNVKAVEYEQINDIIKEELGKPTDQIFQTFQKQPIATASMAQVHYATMRDGGEVVVKVLRPQIRETMLNDISILRGLTRLFKFRLQDTVVDPSQVVDELWKTAQQELDLKKEAQNLHRFGDNNKDIKYIKCPRPYDEYTTSNILVMDYIGGIKITDINTLETEGYDVQEIAEKLASNYLKQIFEDGFFHADPHPGNILIDDKKIAYLDLGMVGMLDEKMLKKLNIFLYAVAMGDLDSMTQSVIRIGIMRKKVNINRLYSDIEQIYNSYIDRSFYNIDLPRFMDEVLKAAKRNNIAMPSDVTMLIKGIMTIEGLLTKLAPEISIMDIAIPYVKEKMLENRDLKKDFLEHLESIYAFSKSGIKLPAKMLELVNSALAGKLKVQMEHINLENSISELSKMVNRLVFGLIVAALIVASAIVINANVGPKIYDISIFGILGYVGAGMMGILLLVSILRSGKM